MNVFVKESLFLLDYNDNKQEVLFLSTDRRTPGYAYEIMIQEHNTGHSDLSFKIPGEIVNENGEKTKNPKLQLIKPLSKVRYNRTIRYMGTEPIAVPNPDGTTTIYPKNNGATPEDYIMEDYTMDYIIQPLDKSRDSLKIDLIYTAIDFPRFNLSKKKVGFTMDEKTLTEQDKSLFKDEPLSVPGGVHYIKWDTMLAKHFQLDGQVQHISNLESQNAPIGALYYVLEDECLYVKLDANHWQKVQENDPLVTSWSPNAQAQTYPLTDAEIKKLINETDFSYGITATVFFWPVKDEGRFEGVKYEKDGFILLKLYDTYKGSNWKGSDYLNSITWEWEALNPIQPLLEPNIASNYLRYILDGTNWKVKNSKENLVINTEEQPWFNEGQKPSGMVENQYYITYNEKEKKTNIYRAEKNDNGELNWIFQKDNTFSLLVNTDIKDSDFGCLYDVDIEQVEVSRSAEASAGQKVLMNAQYDVKVSGANCFNAISAVAKAFDLYPVFDCINKTVTLKLNVGSDFGLSYRFKSNLKNSQARADGEKVITKLYVVGGNDVRGSKNINIGESTRTVVGQSPVLYSDLVNNYPNTGLDNEMTVLEENAYNHIKGLPLVSGKNMNNQTFKINIPDNLCRLKFSEEDLANKKNYNVDLIGFNSGKKISLLYNPTGADHCFYIYINDGAESYKNEQKQLYKFDASNTKVRRNLSEYKIDNIGTVNYVNTTEKADNNIISNYIKYIPSLDERVYEKDGVYKGGIVKTFSDGIYNMDVNLNEEIVLAGPSRVYNIPLNEEKQFSYQIGNYYFQESTGHYLYCARVDTDSNSIYSKINTISINGYLFIDLGDKEKTLLIKIISSNNAKIIDKDNQEVKLKRWFDNGFAMRVEYDGNNLKEVENFNPNNPEYLIGRSPYGTSYIYNFKYLYDNEWITKEQILDIYRVNKEIHNLNLDFHDRYTQDLINTRAAYLDAINNEEIYASKADSQLEALMSQYWITPGQASKKTFSAFPGVPIFTDGKSLAEHTDGIKNKYWETITYDEPQSDGSVKTLEVKKVYFDVFGKPLTNSNYPNSTNGAVNSNPEVEGQYHDVAKAVGWDNIISQGLPINRELEAFTPAQDPSKTADSYNRFVRQMKEYYYRVIKAQEESDKASQHLKDLDIQYKEWQNEIRKREAYLQENYGQYIIEGSYNNDEQPYENLLLEDGLEASDKYATPNITYSVGVVDSSGLIEYRAPQKELCNRLIKRLHNIGQIAPHVGDFISIQDEPMGMFGIPGLITDIQRRIDDPYQNTITIDTSYSDADELVGNIITATNTILSNKDIYGRAAIINNKGQLSSTTVSDALSTGNNSIHLVSSNGKVDLDDNGLTCIDPHNNNRAIRYNGIGILGSTSLPSVDGYRSWRELVTPDGINADYIYAGTLNAGKVSITDGGNDITTLNGDGLAVKTTPGKPYKLGVLTENGEDQNNKFDNLTVFVGRDANGQGVGYFNGYINAIKGGNIGGWQIKPEGLFNADNSSFLSPQGRDGNILKVGDKFNVDTSGVLHATGANISGTITSNNATITGGSLKVGDNFIVDSSGNLTAKNAYIEGNGTFTGNITANSGTFNGTVNANSGVFENCTIKSNCSVDGASINSLSATKISGGTLNIKCNPGFLKAGYNTDHPYVSALNVAMGAGGISFRNGYESNNAMSEQGSIKYVGASNGDANGHMLIRTNHPANIEAGNLGMKGDGYIYLQALKGSAHPGQRTAGSIYLEANKNITLNMNGNLYVYDSIAGKNVYGRTGYITLTSQTGANLFLLFCNGLFIQARNTKPASYPDLNP